MSRWGALLVCCVLAACATGGDRPETGTVILPGGADSSRQILVTVPNPVRAPVRGAGSTPKGYARGAYSVSAEARRAVSELEAEFGMRMIAEWPIGELSVHCAVFEIGTDRSREQLLAALVRDPRVETAQPMQTFVTRSSARADDPYRDLQRALAPMGVEAAHRWSRGRGVRVAIIDTGLDAAHPELAGRIIDSRDFAGGERVASGTESHALAVAGLIAANAANGVGIVGIAPEAGIVALRACWQPDPAGEAACNSFTLALALAAAIDARADIINLSLTGPRDPLLERLVERAIRRRAIVVGALPEQSPAVAAFPTAVPGVIAVQSVEIAGPDSAADALAPGRDILTLAPRGRYDFDSGSSLAAAQVSGVIALLLARRPNLSGVEIRDLLAHSAAGNVVADESMARVVNACGALAELLGFAQCPRPPAEPGVAYQRRVPVEGSVASGRVR